MKRPEDPMEMVDYYHVGFADGAISQPRWRRIILTAATIAAIAFTLGYLAGRTDAATPRQANHSPIGPGYSLGFQADHSLAGAPRDGRQSSGIEHRPTPEVARETRAVGPSGAPPPSPAVPVGATWYCNADPARGPLSRCTRNHPDGPGLDLYAAVSPDLSELRGQAIRVCRGELCVVVRAIDCTCEATNSVDLYADAFGLLAPLSVGRFVGTWTLVP